MSLSGAARALWAKSGTGDGSDWHPLIAHLLDVAACAAVILEREPPSTLKLYAADLGLDEQQALAWACALAGLHDLGKASPAFQQKWQPGKERVWAVGLAWTVKAAPTPPREDVPHSVISQAVLPDLLMQVGWQRRAAKRVADAVGAHHGFRITSRELKRAEAIWERGDETWTGVREEIFIRLLALLKAAQPPTVDRFDGPAYERLAGLTSFADWIGSSLPRAPLDDDLDAYYQGALERARAALDGIGWAQREPLLADQGRSLADVFAYLAGPGATFAPRPLQVRLEEMVAEASGPTLFLVEAPMGEGKTEAALYAHLRLQAANLHRGLYVALPTQATGNAMFKRVRAFLNTVGGRRADTALDLQLLHGATLLNPDFQALVVKSNMDGSNQPPPESSDAPEEGVRAGEWFTHRRRALLSEYGVGTVDQALLAILPTRHQFVRLWGLANRVVLLDEVHAYDTYTSTLIENLVRWLRALNSSVILMTATLPADTRRALLAAWGADAVMLADYPRITRVGNGGGLSQSFQGRPQPVLRLKPAPADPQALADHLLGLVQRGGCAACIVNTVRRAQEIYQALTERAEGIYLLFHARYPTDERLEREGLTLAAFSKQKRDQLSQRPERAILIATQVVEQSLDLDFDVLVTDLAPIDLLLQRAGRLHRFGQEVTERHGHDRPVLYVAGLNGDGSVPDLGDCALIYEPYVLLRTWLALQGRETIMLPDEIDPLVQKVYSEPEPTGLLTDWQAILRRTQGELERRKKAARARAESATFGWPDERDWLDVPPDALPEAASDEPQADDDPMLLSTRLGLPTVTVIPVHLHAGRCYLDAAGTREVRFKGSISRTEAIAWYQRSVRLSQPAIVNGITQHVAAHGISLAGWRKEALLTRCLPLILRDGRATVGGQRLRLDRELGIVYEARGNGES